MKEELKEKEAPFFARFLEGQGFPQVRTNVKGGRPSATTKFPSDLDEDQTMKYPSDDDEGVDR